ncbi:hypothetical protein [Sphingomonas sp. Ag1]|uniref:hypothetical protein n=1 Tax=Sphingomonas sp. Ag1 TaxID=1642949 RepID=UPI0006214EF0|nr:hypothetical protein [Sphingomonas sp. Ag1]KKI22404.1 hypothetical protein XM50_00675 [Sphingomonas sp. Ag1]
MAIDPDRGSFVKEEYRYEVAKDDAVTAVQPNARKITLQTNLDLAAAKVLADEILAEHKSVAQAYRVTLQGVDNVTMADLIDSPPTFACVFPDWPVQQTDTLRSITIVTDYGTFTQEITIKGPQ